MALLHRATLRPSKLDLLAAWLPDRRWCRGATGADLVSVGSYRFDDPAGAVGIETILVGTADGTIHQVPLTYRDAPLDDADEWLVGTTEHSVLGPRWVYDGCADPVYAAALARAVLTGAGQAEEYFEVDGRRQTREPNMTITGGGDADVAPAGTVLRVVDGEDALIVADTVELTVVRRPGAGSVTSTPPGATLTGVWNGQSTPVPLAYARPR
ncbi:hypothetical protein ACFOW4_00660 [Micromonospora sp. GCM10011542]|uniref:CG0192-related protein n=1 Tax=Micromonospora sp. GCM10011542 TaxID=3317337 RepID=UPI0036123E2F